MMTSTQWHLEREAAERYEQILVPAILGPAALALVNWACQREGETVLDVGCGTGAAARFAAEKVGSAGRVIGVDVNAGMIAVARSLPVPNGIKVEWHENSAYDLPIEDQAVDLVLCAQSLQFMDDTSAALAEMARVLKPGGRAAISLWTEMEENPYFHALIETIGRHIGKETAAGLAAIFRLSEADAVRSWISAAGFHSIDIAEQQLDLALPRLEEFIPRHIAATPMAAGYPAASPHIQESVVEEVAERLSPYITESGVCLPFRTRLISAHAGVDTIV